MPDDNPKGIVLLPGLTLTSGQPFSFIAHEWIVNPTTPSFTIHSDQLDAGGAVVTLGGVPYMPVSLNQPVDTTPRAPQCVPPHATGPWSNLVATLGASYSPGTVGTPHTPPQMITLQVSATAMPLAPPGGFIRIYFSLNAAPPPAGSTFCVSAAIPIV
jgi:hypothetical protein